MATNLQLKLWPYSHAQMPKNSNNKADTHKCRHTQFPLVVKWQSMAVSAGQQSANETRAISSKEPLVQLLHLVLLLLEIVLLGQQQPSAAPAKSAILMPPGRKWTTTTTMGLRRWPHKQVSAKQAKGPQETIDSGNNHLLGHSCQSWPSWQGEQPTERVAAHLVNYEAQIIRSVPTGINPIYGLDKQWHNPDAPIRRLLHRLPTSLFASALAPTVMR